MRYQINISKKLAPAIRSIHRFSKECVTTIDGSLKKSGAVLNDIKTGKLQIVATLTVKKKK